MCIYDVYIYRSDMDLLAPATLLETEPGAAVKYVYVLQISVDNLCHVLVKCLGQLGCGV